MKPLPKEVEERLNESRRKMKEAFLFAIGAYTEQESKKLDEWRNQDYYTLFRHLKHELKEVEKSNSLTMQIHNLSDCVGLSCILLSHVLDKSGLSYEDHVEKTIQQWIDEYNKE